MIQFNKASFSYRKNHTLFSDFSLSIDKGGITGLLGKNGAGKTTLLKLIAGMLHPTGGDCIMSGFSSGQRHPEMLQKMFFIPEEFELPNIRISQYVALYAPFYPNFDPEWFKDQLSMFDLDSSAKLYSLSFGQRKKFMLIFGIATNTELLLLDEPTNGLDIPSKSLFRKMILSSMKEDRSFIISTHQVKDVANLIDTLVVLDEGQIVFQKSMMEIFKHLRFSVETDIPEEAIYYEKGIGGYTVIQENKTGLDSSIDLELLFNTIISSPNLLENCFQGGMS